MRPARQADRRRRGGRGGCGRDRRCAGGRYRRGCAGEDRGAMTAAYVSSGAFPSRRLGEILDHATGWGLTHVELSSDIAYDAANVATARAAGRHVRLMLHNYFPAPKEPFVLNLAAVDRDI